MNSLRKNNNAITLIALIITIIIMLILAGIVLNLTIGENGIIRRTQEARIQYVQEMAREKLNLALLDLDSKKVGEQGRHLLLEELIEIQEDGIHVQVNQEGKVEIYTDEAKGQKICDCNSRWISI